MEVVAIFRMRCLESWSSAKSSTMRLSIWVWHASFGFHVPGKGLSLWIPDARQPVRSIWGHKCRPAGGVHVHHPLLPLRTSTSSALAPPFSPSTNRGCRRSLSIEQCVSMVFKLASPSATRIPFLLRLLLPSACPLTRLSTARTTHTLRRRRPAPASGHDGRARHDLP